PKSRTTTFEGLTLTCVVPRSCVTVTFCWSSDVASAEFWEELQLNNAIANITANVLNIVFIVSSFNVLLAIKGIILKIEVITNSVSPNFYYTKFDSKNIFEYF